MKSGAVPEDQEGIDRLLTIMRRLREPGGCPWDREQDHRSLRTYLLEETHEVLDAIDKGDDESLREELGDLLLQVVFHCRIAEESGRFTFEDVIRTVCDKLVRRHPHVFGDVEVSGTEDVLRNWEKIKLSEAGDQGGILSGVPRSLPALLLAYRVLSKLARVHGADGPGFQVSSSTLVQEMVPEADKEEMSARLGELLFGVVHAAWRRELDPETALREYTRRIMDKYETV